VFCSQLRKLLNFQLCDQTNQVNGGSKELHPTHTLVNGNKSKETTGRISATESDSQIPMSHQQHRTGGKVQVRLWVGWETGLAPGRSKQQTQQWLEALRSVLLKIILSRYYGDGNHKVCQTQGAFAKYKLPSELAIAGCHPTNSHYKLA